MSISNWIKQQKTESRLSCQPKTLTGDEIVYKYFEGYWDVRKVDGRWLLWHSRIREVKDPDENWFVDIDFLKELDDFKKTHNDLKKYAALMYGISQEPGNGELSMQELYDIAKKIIDG